MNRESEHLIPPGWQLCSGPDKLWEKRGSGTVVAPIEPQGLIPPRHVLKGLRARRCIRSIHERIGGSIQMVVHFTKGPPGEWSVKPIRLEDLDRRPEVLERAAHMAGSSQELRREMLVRAHQIVTGS